MNLTNTAYINIFKEDLARNIFIIRKALGYNHNELCELTGLTRPILSSIENQSGNPTIETLLKIANALKINPDMMFMSYEKLEKLKNLLRSTYETEMKNQLELYLSDKQWKILLTHSGVSEKKSISIISKVCYQIIKHNYLISNVNFNNVVLGAGLGVVLQKDGFKEGLLFGAWLGAKLY